MLSIWNKKNIRKITILILIVFMFNVLFLNKSVSAYGGQDAPDIGNKNPAINNGTGPHAGETITEAWTNNGVSKEEIKKAIKEALKEKGQDEGLVDEIMNNASSDTNKVTVSYTKGYQGNITNVKVQLKFSDDDYTALEDGTYEANMGSQIDQNTVNRPEDSDDGLSFGLLFEPITWLLKGLGDVINWGIVRSLYSRDVPTIAKRTNQQSDIIIKQWKDINESSNIPFEINEKDISKWYETYWVPFNPITPSEIFSGKVNALNGNIFKEDPENNGALLENSPVKKMRDTISKWYVSLRRLAISMLVCVLLYMGIRIIISSNNGEKAKYKQFFVDWIVALCLVFSLHIIMSLEMNFAEKVTEMLNKGEENKGEIQIIVSGGSHGANFPANFTCAARMMADHDNTILSMGYAVMYLALSIYTFYFAFIYLKRLLMLCFFTLISPLVAITYPIDKMKDSKAQAFNYWLREYTFYAMMQPLHMLLYKVFVSSALSIAKDNMILALVALSFIIPAEKIIKQMFNIKGSTESSMGGFAGGMIASKAMDMIAKKAKVNSNNAANQNKIRVPRNPNQINPMDHLGRDTKAISGSNMEGLSEGIGTAADVAIATTAGSMARDVDTTTRNDSGQQSGAPATGISQNDLDTDYDKHMKDLEQKVANGENLGLDEKIFMGHPDKEQKEIDERRKEYNEWMKHKERSRDRQAIKDHAKKMVKRKYTQVGGWKGALKKTAKGAAKGYARFAGMATLGAVGLSAGIVGGDMSDTLKGLGAGMVAGNMVGKKLGNVNFSNNTVLDLKTELVDGKDIADREKFFREYRKSDENRKRVLAENPDMSLEQLDDQLMREAKIMYDSKLSEYSDVKTAVKMERQLEEEKVPDSHNYAIALTKLSKTYGDSTFVDDNKLQQAQKSLEKKLEKKFIEQMQAEIDDQNKNNKHKNSATLERLKKENQKKASEEANKQATSILERIRKSRKL